MKITWPTAIVMTAFVTAYIALTALGKEVPPWLLTVVAAIGTGATAAMHKLFPDVDPPPPAGSSVLSPDEEITAPRPVPTVRPIRRTDDELLAEFRGADTWPPPPFAAAVLALLFFSGCASTETQAKRAAITGGHAVELKECRDEGAQSGSYAVYQRCADEVDLKYGLRKDGGQ